MKNHAGNIVVGIFGVVALGAAVAAGFTQQKIDARSPERAEIRNSSSDWKSLERRRGRMAEPAIADTTAQ
ncbi:MAG: hypothetical protein PGN21_08505 [Sphingomonas paucimobilis]